MPSSRNRKPKPEDQQRPMLGELERNFMLVNMLRRPSSFDRARSILTLDRFTPEEKWLATLWLCACEHYDEFNELPGKEALVARFNAKFGEDQEAFSDDDLTEADEFIATMYDFPEESLNDKVAFGWLRKFLEDRLVDTIREALTTPMTPMDMTTRINNWATQSSSYQSLDGQRLKVAFPEGWDAEEDAFIDKRPTGLSIFDSFTDGGDAAGEVYGLLGPYGGGKTTTAVMLTAQRAKDAYTRWIGNAQQGPVGLSFHFSYEEPVANLRLRVLSYIAEIPKRTLEAAIRLRNYEGFSRATALKPYEQRRYAVAIRSGNPVHGELERFLWAQAVLNKCWRVVDMTGNDRDHPGRGSGLVDEVAAIVRQEVDMAARDGEQVTVDLALVDYVLAAIERHTDDTDALRHYIRNFPMHMKTKVAIPFRCPGWIMHQLNPEANALAPGKMPKKTDASEGRAFAERLDFLFAIGNATREGLAAFGPLKVRRVRMEAPIVVQLDGDNAVLLDKRGEYAINERSNRIMRADEDRVIGGARAIEDVVEDMEEAQDEHQTQAMTRQQQALRRSRQR
jgi:hypothetical protein